MRSSYFHTLLLLLPVLLLLSCSPSTSRADQPNEHITPGALPALRTEAREPVAEAAGVSSSQPKHLMIALSYAGTQELGNNGGPEVSRFLKAVHLNAGNPYCAAFVSFCLDKADAYRPVKRTALAYNFITKASIPARKVLRGTVAIPDGTILIFRKGSTIYGHTGFVIEQTGQNKFSTIEANTSSGPYGNQSDGEGVWKRTRSIQPGNYFRITNFTLVTYE